MKLSWRILLENGTERKGACDWTEGPLHVVQELPEDSALKEVSAEMDFPAETGSRFFVNGYQTWTYCREMAPKEKTRGISHLPEALIRKFSFDRYGDYHFAEYPNKPGVQHGESWCYLRRGDSFRLVASLDEGPGYTLLYYNAAEGRLTLKRDCCGMKVSGPFHAFDLYYAQGSEEDVFDGWFGEMNIRPRTAERLYGYTSWYNRYEDISAEAIRQDLAGCRELLSPGDLFQIDDGWEPGVGDWLEPDAAKFPQGMKAICDEIHGAGFRAGLWLAPFVCRTESKLAKEHPDWLLKVNGESWSCGSNWGGFVSLDIDHPGVQDYLTRVFNRVLNEWGFDLVKLDFLYGAAPFGSESESRAGRMIRAMKWLRELCGEKLILGCGVPVMPAFGLADYCRVSCDVSLDWNDKPYMRLMHRERVSTRQAMITGIFRRELNNRAFVSDPDVVFLRDENLKLSEKRKQTLAAVSTVLGGVLLISDDPGSYTASQRNAYKQLRRLAEEAESTQVDADNGLAVTFVMDGAPWRMEVK